MGEHRDLKESQEEKIETSSRGTHLGDTAEDPVTASGAYSSSCSGSCSDSHFWLLLWLMLTLMLMRFEDNNADCYRRIRVALGERRSQLTNTPRYLG